MSSVHFFISLCSLPSFIHSIFSITLLQFLLFLFCSAVLDKMYFIFFERSLKFMCLLCVCWGKAGYWRAATVTQTLHPLLQSYFYTDTSVIFTSFSLVLLYCKCFFQIVKPRQRQTVFVLFCFFTVTYFCSILYWFAVPDDVSSLPLSLRQTVNTIFNIYKKINLLLFSKEVKT